LHSLSLHDALPISADAAVGEEDGDLAHGEAALQRAVGELDLEGISARADRGQVDGFEDLTPEAFEATRQVSHRDAEDEASVEAAALAQQPAAEAPVRGAAAPDVAEIGRAHV